MIIKEELLESGSEDIPEMLQYRTFAANDSCYNTPPTFGIYVVGLVLKWILDQGGLSEIGLKNAEKART